jgi:iron complex outermembrane receptor protein
MKRWGLVAASLLAGSALSSYARAQSDPGAAPAPGETSAGSAPESLEEVAVYAARHGSGESAQNVPMAVTALNTNLLQAANTVNITDIGALMPNVQTPTVATFPGFPNFSIRGVGVSSSLPSVDPAVNILQDGMVIAFQGGALPSTFDLESVEVLRGPQGVLFGRNATGGAISFRTRRPGDSFQVLADVDYGNFNTADVSASVEGPIGTPDVLGKVAVIYRHSDGLFTNTNDGIFVPAPGNPTGAPILHGTGQVGGVDEITLKPTFEFNLGDSNTLTLFTQYERYNDGASYPRIYVPPNVASTPLQTVYGFTPTATGYSTNITNDGYEHLDEKHVIGELVSHFGAAQLTTTAAWRHVVFDTTVNFDGTPFALYFLPDNHETSGEYSFETRLNVPVIAKRLDLTAGLFYMDYTMNVTEQRAILSATAAAPFAATFARQVSSQTDNAVAGYANFDWHVIDNLTISAGGRYSSEAKDFTGTPVSNCIGQSFSNCPLTFSALNKRWNNFSPRAVVDYQATDSVLAYASYTEGFRSGNFNDRATTADAFGPANPETVDSYEVGMKSDLLGKTLRVDLDGFYEKYQNIQQVLTLQIPGAAPIQTILNAATATIKGIEAELTERPIPALRFEENFGYTDPRFTAFNVPVPGVANPTSLQFSRIPKYNTEVAANYTRKLATLPGDFQGRVGYSWRSGFFTDLPNTPQLRQSSYGLLDANLSYVTDKWTVGLFGRNLGNTDYADIKGHNFAYVEWGGQPRTFGIRFTTKLF